MTKALIVLGMHRSGTSAFTGSLNCLGIELGRKLYQGHANINVKGYWEHSDIVDTHDEILRLLSSRWDDINPLPVDWESSDKIRNQVQRLEGFIKRDFRETLFWGLKDPRMCRLLPLWKSIFKKNNIDPFYIFISRQPLEVAHSLERRNGFPVERGLFLWLDHNIQAEKLSRNNPRIFLTYDQLLTNPRMVFERIENAIDTPLPIKVSEGWKCIEKFIENDLRHHKIITDTSVSCELEKLSLELFSKLTALSERDSQFMDDLDLSEISDKFDNYRNSLPEFMLRHISELNSDYANISGLWNEVYTSFSWQIMKPIRFVERLIKRNFLLK